MFVPKRASSIKQMAYAKRLLGAQGMSKKEIALDCGYSPAVSNSISSHIENKPGFNNAMAALAVESNNLALAAMSEFKARGFHDFSNKDLIGALNAIGNAWARFNQKVKEPNDSPNGNKLRTVILQQVQNQQLLTEKGDAVRTAKRNAAKKPPVVEATVVKEGETLDF